MTTSGDPRLPDSVKADQKFFAEARKRSPVFPTVNDAIELRRRQRETVAARTMLVFLALFILGAPFSEHSGFMWGAAVACFVGFCMVCISSGNRAWRQSGGGR